MPWKEASVISLRKEFVELAINGSNISRLCESFGISRKTGYKWIDRYSVKGEAALGDRSRRPGRSPGQVNKEMEQAVVKIRQEHPVWGGRKIKKRLQNLGYRNVPAASTITSILQRNGYMDRLEREKHIAFERFQRDEPNDF